MGEGMETAQLALRSSRGFTWRRWSRLSGLFTVLLVLSFLPGKAFAAELLPDLTVSALRIRSTDQYGVYQVEIRVTNRGRAPSDATSVRLMLRSARDGAETIVASESVTALQPRESIRIETTVQPSDPASRPYLVAVVDPDNEIAERRETNNRRSARLPQPRGTPPSDGSMPSGGQLQLGLWVSPLDPAVNGCASITAGVHRDSTGVPNVRVLYGTASEDQEPAEWLVLGTTNSYGYVPPQQICGDGSPRVIRLFTCADTNANDRCDTNEPRAQPAWIYFGLRQELRQSTQAQVVGQPVEVTYCAWLGDSPLPDLPVIFLVSLAREGSRVTDSNGCARFSFQRDTVPTGWRRTVSVAACADLNRNGECDRGSGSSDEPWRETEVAWGTIDEIYLYPDSGAAFSYLRTGESRVITVKVQLVPGGSGTVWGGVAGQQVIAAWSGANNGYQVGETDWEGKVTFQYQGTNPGEDEIILCLDRNRNGLCEATEQREEYFRSSWITGASVEASGIAVDGDPATPWTAGACSTEGPLSLHVRTEGGPSVPLVVQVQDGTARVALDCSGVVKARKYWVGDYGTTLRVFVQEGGPGDTFQVQVWLDRNNNGLAEDNELLVVEQTITLTE